MSELQIQLESFIENTPKKVTGNEIINALIDKLSSDFQEKRSELLFILKHWLANRSEPLTMYAVELAGHFKMSELNDDLVVLLEEIQNGEMFEPYYASWVRKSLDCLTLKIEDN